MAVCAAWLRGLPRWHSERARLARKERTLLLTTAWVTHCRARGARVRAPAGRRRLRVRVLIQRGRPRALPLALRAHAVRPIRGDPDRGGGGSGAPLRVCRLSPCMPHHPDQASMVGCTGFEGRHRIWNMHAWLIVRGWRLTAAPPRAQRAGSGAGGRAAGAPRDVLQLPPLLSYLEQACTTGCAVQG